MMKARHFYAAMVMVSLVVLGAAGVVAQEPPPPEDPFVDEPLMTGTIEGTGTYFEVTDSEYLNVTFESSEPVSLMLESIPQMVVMHIEALEGATSTWITLGGFPPSSTYYKYEDDYHNEGAFTTDVNGSYTYAQDLSQPHLVFIQPGAGTKHIPSDPDIGTWDPLTRTYTLTTDVYETIQIDEDDLTLDGAGYTVTGPGWGFGGYLSGRTGVTIKDLNVRGFSYGIYLNNSSNNTLTGNTANSNNWYGMYLRYSSNNTLTGNTANSNIHSGIYLLYSSNNTLTGNTASNSYCGIYLAVCSGNTLTENTASNNGYGIVLPYSSGNTLTGNTANWNNHSGIYLNSCSNNTLTGNTANSNNFRGIYLSSCSNNTLTGNTASNNLRGIDLQSSSDNQVYNNSFLDNLTQAYVYPASGNVFNLPKPIGGNYWSDWTTPDDDGDGFVDYPYVFSGGQDNLPWARQDGWANKPPVADANGPYIEPATSWDGAIVTLDGTASYDPDGDTLTYTWAIGDEVIGITCTVDYLFPIGLTEDVSLAVEDPSGATDTVTTTVTVTIIDVQMDVKPGSYPNSINLGSNGVVPVAFLTDEVFDAATIDPATVTMAGLDFFGLVRMRGKGGQTPVANLEDVDGDGDLDLVVQLETENLALEPTDTMCVMGALTLDGWVVQGEDFVRIVPQ